jgi:hypothetical protein
MSHGRQPRVGRVCTRTRTCRSRGQSCGRELPAWLPAFRPPDPGTRDLLVPLLGAVLPSLLEAAGALYKSVTEQDRLGRQTIQTQLEATQWSRFADITP